MEPALEAIHLLEENHSHRLNLICLDVETNGHVQEDSDEIVETRKRKVVRKKRAVSHLNGSPPPQLTGSPVSLVSNSSCDSSATTVFTDSTRTVGNPLVQRTQSRDSAVTESIQSCYFDSVSSEPLQETCEPSKATNETEQKIFCDIFWKETSTNSTTTSPTKVNGVVQRPSLSPQKQDDLDDEFYYKFSKGIRLGNNARLRAMIDILPAEEEEQIQNTFMCFKGSLFGVHHRPPLVYLMFTSRGLYLMNHVHENQLFTLEVKIEFEEIRHVLTDYSMQGLIFVSNNKVQAEVCTASQEFTMEIIQALKSSCHGIVDIEILEDKVTKKIMIEKSLAKYLCLDLSQVKLKHAVTVFCGRALDDSVNFDSLLESSELLTNFDEGSFGLKEGVLMYRFMNHEEQEGWLPGYFVLADGYIYCYSDATKNQLKFFGQLFNNHCKGCRRITDDSSRPHVIELKIVVDNVLQELNLAASNETETTEWMVNLLTSVNLESSENIGHFDGKNCIEKFCLLVMTEDAMFTLVRDVGSNMFLVLDHVNICDVVTTMTSSKKSDSSFSCVILDFEASQTSNSREWTLYFVSPEECQRFLGLLSLAWQELFQVPLQTIVLGEPFKDKMSKGFDDEDHSEANIAQQTLERLSCWHRNAAFVLKE